MRRTIIGLAVAGVLAAAGCSDSDVGGEAAGQSGDTFCADFEALDERFRDDEEAASEDVVAALEGLEPPDEIADDFAVVVESARGLSELDPSDPEAAQQAQELADDAAESQGRLSTYLEDECEIDLGA